jgi:hypothetical protein
VRDLVYPNAWQTDNHGRNHPTLDALMSLPRSRPTNHSPRAAIGFTHLRKLLRAAKEPPPQPSPASGRGSPAASDARHAYHLECCWLYMLITPAGHGAQRAPSLACGGGLGWGLFCDMNSIAAGEKVTPATGSCALRQLRARSGIKGGSYRQGGEPAPANRNEGVGEHVRVRSHRGKAPPVKLRTTDPHRMKNANKATLGSSAGPFSAKSELFRKSRSGRLT